MWFFFVYSCSISKAFFPLPSGLSMQTMFLLNSHSINRMFKRRQVLCIKTINECVSSIVKVRKKLPGWLKRQILPLSIGLPHLLMAYTANANLNCSANSNSCHS